MNEVLEVCNLAKTFVLHPQHGTQIPVFENVNFAVRAGECMALTGPSGSGKSTLLRMLYGNYKTSAGSIWVSHNNRRVDLGRADPRQILALRRHAIGYVSQFLKVIPRVPTRQLVADPLITSGVAPEVALECAHDMLARLNVPEPLWRLPPATFSGGEQQRVNLARGFAKCYPLLLLDEPTASLDEVNRSAVIALIKQARDNGAAVVTISHDVALRSSLATRELDMVQFAAAAWAAA